MSGIYIICGDFEGEDKSGDPIYQIFDEIAASLSQTERQMWETDLMKKIRKADEDYDREKDVDDYDNTLFCISQNLSAILLPFLQKYHSDLETEYLAKYPQFKSAFDALLEGHAREANAEDIEYKAHALFKHGCVEDLMKACQLSIKTGEDVTIYCD